MLSPTLAAVLLRAPRWVPPGATLAADFANQRYWKTSPNDLLSITRATTGYARNSDGTYTQFNAGELRIGAGSGLLIESARTNLFLNSQAPATQSIAVTNGSVYTTSVIGAASIALTDAANGTVTEGVPKTFTALSGTLTCTVSGAGGSFQNAQVELGSGATSPIVTAGGTATRNADSILFSGLGKSILSGTDPIFTMAIKLSGLITNNGSARMLGPQAQIIYANSGAGLQSFDGSFGNALAVNDVTLANAFAVGLSNSASKRTLMAYPCSPVPSSTGATIGTWTNPRLGGTGSATEYWSGYFTKLAIWNYQLADAQLQTILSTF